jgi:putative ATP-binding cassette transporter
MVRIGCKLANGHARLTWITSGYGWLAIIVPFLLAAPGFFGGSLTLGGLMMVAGAFQQVQNSLRWFVDNFAGIADWRATLLRVASFRNRLKHMNAPAHDGPDCIAVDAHPNGNLRFENLSVLLSDGWGMLDTPVAEIEGGERVLIAGPAGSGKSRVLRAAAGLWSSGSGRILLPEPAAVMFVPPRPYLPLGTLRDAIAYPSDASRFDDDELRAALMRAGLSNLTDRLDERERWDKILSTGEQHRLVLARLVVHAPRWIFLEDTMASMDAEDCRLMLSVFEGELSASAVIGIGSAPALDGFYERTLRLIRVTNEPPPPVQTREERWALPALQAAE